MSPPGKENEEKAKATQVGLLMKAYRESFPREDGRRGITQTELLRRMGHISPYYGSISSHGAVSRWESGVTPLTVERIETFGKALNLSNREIDGIILLAGLDPSYQETRTLACLRCGGETVTAQVESKQSRSGDEPVFTTATRLRRCLACGHSEESRERWAGDPHEAGNRKMEQLLGCVEGAADRIKQALREVSRIPRAEDPQDDAEGEGHPGPQEQRARNDRPRADSEQVRADSAEARIRELEAENQRLRRG